MSVSSIHNPLIQELRKAARSGRPMPDGLVVAEGPHLLQEAIDSLWHVEKIFHTEDAYNRFAPLLQRASRPLTLLPERAFASISATETTQGILSLVRPRRWEWRDITDGSSLVVVLDAVQDPGNVGTIIRSAEAFQANAVILTDGCARSSNGKVLRAAAGSLFRMPFLERLSARHVANELAASEFDVYALSASGEVLLTDVDFRSRCALVVGNEGSGIGPELLSLACQLKIPTHRVESLNASAACAIALFEAAGQRSGK